ncbi:hypothetical protein, partial [Enterobacter hormaechei]|uniref:hypothetical protein n=1 Tax=Enterobacter hormaechei TaxID=158836 RepID=UPI0023E3E005
MFSYHSAGAISEKGLAAVASPHRAYNFFGTKFSEWFGSGCRSNGAVVVVAMPECTLAICHGVLIAAIWEL